MSQDNLIKFECTDCGRVNYYERKNMKKFRGQKITKKKYCSACNSHVDHTERK